MDSEGTQSWGMNQCHRGGSAHVSWWRSVHDTLVWCPLEGPGLTSLAELHTLCVSQDGRILSGSVLMTHWSGVLSKDQDRLPLPSCSPFLVSQDKCVLSGSACEVECLARAETIWLCHYSPAPAFIRWDTPVHGLPCFG